MSFRLFSSLSRPWIDVAVGIEVKRRRNGFEIDIDNDFDIDFDLHAFTYARRPENPHKHY